MRRGFFYGTGPTRRQDWLESGAWALIVFVVVILLYMALCVLVPLPLLPGIADEVEIIHHR